MDQRAHSLHDPAKNDPTDQIPTALPPTAPPTAQQNFNNFLDGDRYVGAEMVARILQGGPQVAGLDM